MTGEVTDVGHGADHDFQALNLQVQELTAQVVDRVAQEQWDGPTPCPPWRVRELLGHMVAQNLRWAAAARGDDVDAACPPEGPAIGADGAAVFRASAAEAAEAYAKAADDQVVLLPEFGGRRLPLRTAISFIVLDFVAHAWDMAVSVGVPYAPPDDLVEVAIEVSAVIGEPARQPGGPFRAVVPQDPQASPLHRLLGILGRDPGWRPAE